MTDDLTFLSWFAASFVLVFYGVDLGLRLVARGILAVFRSRRIC